MTLHLTFRALQHRHAFGARRLLLLGGRSGRPASMHDRFRVVAICVVAPLVTPSQD